MSLVEVMVATSIGTLCLLTMTAIFLFSERSFAALANYTNLELQSRFALDIMSREIRQARRLTLFSAASLTFEDSNGKPLIYSYNPDDRTLLQVKDDAKRVLLTECDYLEFSIYTRNTIAGSFEQYPAPTPDKCKLVQLQWVCSRKILGTKMNTESMQSAKIVIRK